MEWKILGLSAYPFQVAIWRGFLGLVSIAKKNKKISFDPKNRMTSVEAVDTVY